MRTSEEWRALLAERLVWKESTRSTNDDARRLMEDGAETGTVVVAERQTAGRGRKGAEWFCAPGNGLAFSVVLAPAWPPAEWAWAALGAGLAVCEGLERMGFSPSLKWPNDVLLNDRKVCGILVEASSQRLVVGIGLNVNGADVPAEFEAISLEQAGGAVVQRERVLEVVWRNLMNISGRPVAEIRDAVWERLAWREGEVEVWPEGRRGRIVGLGLHGELVVESGGEQVALTDAGSLRRCSG